MRLPTKRIQLPSWIYRIAAFCEPYGLVLDPFCGSGSTLVAARRIGRNFIGVTLDVGHFLTASRRIQPAPHAPKEIA